MSINFSRYYCSCKNVIIRNTGIYKKHIDGFLIAVIDAGRMRALLLQPGIIGLQRAVIVQDGAPVNARNVTKRITELIPGAQVLLNINIVPEIY